MPVSFGRHPGAIADVELEQHGREGLDGGRVGQLNVRYRTRVAPKLTGIKA